MFVEKIEAKTAPPSSTALTAAKALSKVDPVVVPHLADVLNRKVFAELMITALARLKTDKAIDAPTRPPRQATRVTEESSSSRTSQNRRDPEPVGVYRTSLSSARAAGNHSSALTLLAAITGLRPSSIHLANPTHSPFAPLLRMPTVGLEQADCFSPARPFRKRLRSHVEPRRQSRLPPDLPRRYCVQLCMSFIDHPRRILEPYDLFFIR
jgi:hypothetical protein